MLGVLTVVVTLAMIGYMLTKQSFRQFFPYLFGDNAILLDDLKQLYVMANYQSHEKKA
ncbi:hypothetical protein [Photobacterium leiognathi]|uniref:hypothetical protein n=1 Tax=Photobacterium leiognathi TaxID=553611 RepID=UPI0027390F47|nr:hypothetical protein [Photobacterium leiognathi]